MQSSPPTRSRRPPIATNPAGDALLPPFSGSAPSPPADTDSDGMPDAWEIGQGAQPERRQHQRAHAVSGRLHRPRGLSAGAVGQPGHRLGLVAQRDRGYSARHAHRRGLRRRPVPVHPRRPAHTHRPPHRARAERAPAAHPGLAAGTDQRHSHWTRITSTRRSSRCATSVRPDLFAGFSVDTFPKTSMAAFALTAAADRTGDPALSEDVGMALRDALFEQGLDIGRPDVVEAIARRFGLEPLDARRHRGGRARRLGRGQAPAVWSARRTSSPARAAAGSAPAWPSAATVVGNFIVAWKKGTENFVGSVFS